MYYWKIKRNYPQHQLVRSLFSAYLYYTGDLRKDIANLTFADDSVEMNEEVRFQNHYKVMQKLHTDTLLILDNFNVLPKDEPFLKELMKNDMQLLITSRCKLKNYDFIEEVNCHTLTVCMAALTLEASGMEPDNDYSKSTARYLYSLYMRWGKKELAEQYKKSGRYIPANSQLSIRLVGYPPSHYPLLKTYKKL